MLSDSRSRLRSCRGPSLYAPTALAASYPLLRHQQSRRWHARSGKNGFTRHRSIQSMTQGRGSAVCSMRSLLLNMLRRYLSAERPTTSISSSSFCSWRFAFTRCQNLLASTDAQVHRQLRSDDPGGQPRAGAERSFLIVACYESTPVPKWLGFESPPPVRLGEESLCILPSRVHEPQAAPLQEVQPRRSERTATGNW